MNFDIIFVAYNSEKWIDNCFKSITENDYNLNKISIIVVDNNSCDDTVIKLKKIKEKIGLKFNNFKIIELKKNFGFGKGNNLGFIEGNSPYAFFLNIDTEVTRYTLKNLETSIAASSSDVGLWELRQFPYEHPKMYNPVTLETSWSSGAAFVVKREVFKSLGGFDENIFMYAEDVDLSWRIRSNGYKLKYEPSAVVYHYCYKEVNEVKPNQYYNSIINNLLLKYKFGTIKDVLCGYIMVLKLLGHKGPFAHSRKVLIKRFVKHYFQVFPFVIWNLKNKRKLKDFKPNFYGYDYEISREGAFYYNEFAKNNPCVSIIVRTCGRVNVLRETLISLTNQTYNNIEVLVIEDGKNFSEEMIKEEFPNLNILYKATGEKVGRCKAGNIGLTMASGKYLNFLDDDDVFFADHIEVLVSQLEKNNQYRIAYSLAYETPIKVTSIDPYIYTEMFHNLIYRQQFNRLLMFHHNYIPIQSIMFEKQVFLEEGGFDEKLDFLEDWDLWVRYALKNDFLHINKVTSLYRVPFDRSINAERQKKFDDALISLREKHSEYFSQVNVSFIAKELSEILDSYVIKISSEVYALIKAKRPFTSKLIVWTKNIVKKLFT